MMWRDVPGWHNESSDLYLEAAMLAPPGSTLVEVGVAFGRSLLHLAELVKQVGRSDVRVVGVDPFAPFPEHHFMYVRYKGMPQSELDFWEYTRKHGGSVRDAFMRNVRECGMDDIVDVLPMRSVEATRMFHPAARPHFVFIDGYHIYEEVKADIDAWWDIGPEWIAGDDYNPGTDNFPGVWRAVHDKFGAANVEHRDTTNWVVRRSTIERPLR